MGKRLAVAFPDTVLEEKDSLRDKTAKLGLIARTCAIYGVDHVEVFPDSKGRGDPDLILRVLQYVETPQYLRKRLYPLSEDLRYAGMLPPLKIPSHKPGVPVKEVRVGDVREGVTNGDGSVDVGLDENPYIEGGTGRGARVTVKVTSKSPFSVVEVRKADAGAYWGYDVVEKRGDEVLRDRSCGVKVATSRLGEPLAKEMTNLRASVKGSDGVKLVFGSPSRGLFDVLGQALVREADFVLNLFGEQHVETVRTEEAIFAGLNLVDVLICEKA